MSRRNKKVGAAAGAALAATTDTQAMQDVTASAAAPPAVTTRAPPRRLTEVERLAESKLPPASSCSSANCGSSTGPSLACSLAYTLDDGGMPVFTPNWEEFESFAKFIEEVESVGAHYGCVKVTPPAEFLAKATRFSQARMDASSTAATTAKTAEGSGGDEDEEEEEGVKIYNPARQEVTAVKSYSGAFRIRNVDTLQSSRHALSLQEFQAQAVAAEARRSPRERALADANDWLELERTFWRGTLSNAPLYGADSAGSLFADDSRVWNVARLPSLLHVLPTRLPGINEPFLYWGTWKSMFGFHKEDVDLYSINYVHFGKPKQWYVIRPSDAWRLEALFSQVFPIEMRNCPDFIRHKESLISPALLKQHRVPFITTRQMPGQYMVLWPAAYHQGFNYGINCAESVNFATHNWLKAAKHCTRCLCKGGSGVWVPRDELRNRARQLQWLYRQEQQQQQQQQPSAAHSKRKAKSSAAAASSSSSSAAASSTPLTRHDVPASYELDTSSLWLGLPTDPRDLAALRKRYFADVDEVAAPAAAEGEDEEGVAPAAGRSMSGRSMTGGRSMTSKRMMVDAHDDDEDDARAFAGDSNAVFCTYADCAEPLHANQRALMKHYRDAHAKKDSAHVNGAPSVASASAAASASSTKKGAAASGGSKNKQQLAGTKRASSATTSSSAGGGKAQAAANGTGGGGESSRKKRAKTVTTQKGGVQTTAPQPIEVV